MGNNYWATSAKLGEGQKQKTCWLNPIKTYLRGLPGYAKTQITEYGLDLMINGGDIGEISPTIWLLYDWYVIQYQLGNV